MPPKKKVVIDYSERADAMDEYSTIENYQDIPCDFAIPSYLTTPLWKHQYQAIYSMLKAESSSPIKSKSGEIFYSESGLLPMPTGTGKTRMILGLACFDVNPRPVKHNIAGSSLNFMMLKKKKRENINITIISTKSQIIDDAWLKDLQISYPHLPYYKFNTIGVFEKEATSSPEYNYQNNYLDQIIGFVGNSIYQLNNNQISQSDFEMLMTQIQDEDIEDVEDAQRYVDEKNIIKKNLKENLIIDKIVSILKQHKILFITKDSFHFLFKVFKKYTVDRIIFDEPQDITITRQDEFRDYLPDERIKQLRSSGNSVPFYEETPARFIWYVSATPYDIPKNIDNHYINGWINKNDYVINDYISNDEDKRMFPELVSTYVVKFPLTYILEQKPELLQLVRKFRLKCKITPEGAIVHGVIDSDIDSFIENDDYNAAIKKMSPDGLSNNILDAVTERINLDIRKMTKRIENYDHKTPKHTVAKSNDDLIKLNEKLHKVQNKINIYRGVANSNDECAICKEHIDVVPTQGLSPEKQCMVHMDCMNMYHMGCVKTQLETSNKCICCKSEMNQMNIKGSYDQNGYNIQQQIQADQNEQSSQGISNDFFYSNKLNAIIESLKPKQLNGYSIPRRKILLFINFGNESANLQNIVKMLQMSGFNVRLPFSSGTLAELENKFPTYNGYRVTQPKGAKGIRKEIETFNNSQEPFVWIFRNGKESMGMNFPFVDTSIQYSEYGRQVTGRALRMDRVDPLDIITLYHK